MFSRKNKVQKVNCDTTMTKLEDLTGKLPVLELEDEKFKKAKCEIGITDKLIEIFNEAPDDEMYGEVLEFVLARMGSVYGVFGYIDGKGDWVCPSITRDIWDKCKIPNKSVVFPHEAWTKFATWGRVYRERKTVIENYPIEVPEGHLAIRRIMIAPIMFNSTMIGMLTVANKEMDYIKDDQNMLEKVARLISPILMARLQRDGILEKGGF